jgi:hypothetical protein
MASCATTPSAHQSVNRPPTFTEGKLSTLEKNARIKKKKKTGNEKAKTKETLARARQARRRKN